MPTHTRQSSILLCLVLVFGAFSYAAAKSDDKATPRAEADPYLVPREYWQGEFRVTAVIVPRDKSKIEITEIPEQKVIFSNIFLTQDVTSRPSRKKPVAPVFPYDLNTHRIEGDVVIAVVVEPDGKAKEFRILAATEKRFADSVSETIKRTVFEPAKIGDVPVRCVLVMPYFFRLAKP